MPDPGLQRKAWTAPAPEPMPGSSALPPVALQQLITKEAQLDLDMDLPHTPMSPLGSDTMENNSPEYSYPSSDLDGLLAYFEELEKGGVRLTEVTYVVNMWSLGKIIPLQHHGFVVKAEGRDWLTLDFSRRGILWDTFDEYPDTPEGTIFAKRYQVDVNPAELKRYCKDTPPFSWHSNDCRQWAKGVMQVMGIDEDPLADPAAFRKPQRSAPTGPGGLHCGAEGPAGDLGQPVVISCFT